MSYGLNSSGDVLNTGGLFRFGFQNIPTPQTLMKKPSPSHTPEPLLLAELWFRNVKKHDGLSLKTGTSWPRHNLSLSLKKGSKVAPAVVAMVSESPSASAHILVAAAWGPPGIIKSWERLGDSDQVA